MTKEINPDSLDFISDFYNCFDISKPIANDTCRPHPKYSKYLQSNLKDHQEKRRKEFFDNLKRQREKLLEKFRPLLNFVEDDIEEMPVEDILKSPVNHLKNPQYSNEKSNSHDDMQVDDHVKSNRKSRKYRQKSKSDFGKVVSKQLMLSEWLVEVPEDFYTNWYVMGCPKGKRAVIIASHGRTRVYSRTGYFLFEFKSLLPGGCLQNSSNGNIMTKSTILDCIFVEKGHTFYILDVITWNGCTFYDCETEFRFYWLQSNFNEVHNPKLQQNIDIEMSDCECDPTNDISRSVCKVFRFKLLEFKDCTVENIRQFTNGSFNFDCEVDGILFYHKRSPYTPGITPLVCWLKIHMISNILNIHPDH